MPPPLRSSKSPRATDTSSSALLKRRRYSSPVSITATPAPAYADIDFAFRFNGAGHADVLQNGTYVGGDTSYAVGDVFRIAVVGGTVLFSRNGSVVLERTTPVTYPLIVDTALATIGSTLRGAIIGSSTAAGAFVEKAGSQTFRARFTPSQIASFLPAGGATGRFTFPAPYNTDGVRLTSGADCARAGLPMARWLFVLAQHQQSHRRRHDVHRPWLRSQPRRSRSESHCLRQG